MVLAISIIIFFISCILEACGKDWEMGQWLAERRTDVVFETSSTLFICASSSPVVHKTSGI